MIMMSLAKRITGWTLVLWVFLSASVWPANTSTIKTPQAFVSPAICIKSSAEAQIGWEQYGGGPEHQGRQFFNATVTRLDVPIWQTDAEGLMASSVPCLIEDSAATIPVRVYCWGADATGYNATEAFIKCFDGDTGKRLWTSDAITEIGFTIGFDSWHSMAADKASGKVFVGMGNRVYCFDAWTGSMLWESDPLRVDAGGTAVVCNATCVIGKKYVYQTTYTGFGGTNYVQAFNKTDGSEAWYYADGGQGQETMVYHEEGDKAYLFRTRVKGYYPNGGGGLCCLNADTGQLIWNNDRPLDDSQAWATEYSNYGGISYYDGELFSPTYNFGGVSELICVDAATGALKWRATDSVASDAIPVVIDNIVYVTGHYDWNTGPSYVVGFNGATGEKVYEQQVATGNNMWNTSIAATNDRIYVTEGSSLFGMKAYGLHMLYPGDDSQEAATTNSLTQRLRGSVAIGKDGAIYALMDTVPDSGLAHLICYRAPVAGTLAIKDRDAPTTNSGTLHSEVTVLHEARWASEMRVWEDSQTTGSWTTYATSSPLTLSAGNGLKTVYAEYRNGSGDSERVSATILAQYPTRASVKDWMLFP
jgi:outer membrane protein assembly factor BamB